MTKTAKADWRVVLDRDVEKRLLAEREAAEAKVRQKLEATIAAGPPARSGVTAKNWANHHRYGFVTCPGTGKTCTDKGCRLGVACAELQKVGLDGLRQPLKRRKRPTCEAKTRDGSPCEMRVEPGSPRCRLHGGLSTGPKSKSGRMRLAWLMAYRRDPEAVIAAAKKGR